MQEKLNIVLLSIWSHIPIDLSVWASNIVYQREIWSLPTGAVDTIFHGQSRITGKIARKNDKNKSISLKLKYFLIAGAHNLKLVCSATYCNMTTNTPCFSRFPIDLTWQPVSAWHHASFWNRKRRWRHRSVRIVNSEAFIENVKSPGSWTAKLGGRAGKRNQETKWIRVNTGTVKRTGDTAVLH